MKDYIVPVPPPMTTTTAVSIDLIYVLGNVLLYGKHRCNLRHRRQNYPILFIFYNIEHIWLFKVTWWKPWRPDPTKSLDMVHPSTTSRPIETLNPVDVVGMDCNKRSYWPHEKCGKVRKTIDSLLCKLLWMKYFWFIILIHK